MNKIKNREQYLKVLSEISRLQKLVIEYDEEQKKYRSFEHIHFVHNYQLDRKKYLSINHGKNEIQRITLAPDSVKDEDSLLSMNGVKYYHSVDDILKKLKSWLNRNYFKVSKEELENKIKPHIKWLIAN